MGALQAMVATKPVRKKIATQQSTLAACGYVLIAAYPHLKGYWPSKRRHQAAPMKRPLSVCRARCVDGFTVPGGAPITGFLRHAESGPFPTTNVVVWMRCGATCMVIILRRGICA